LEIQTGKRPGSKKANRKSSQGCANSASGMPGTRVAHASSPERPERIRNRPIANNIGGGWATVFAQECDFLLLVGTVVHFCSRSICKSVESWCKSVLRTLLPFVMATVRRLKKPPASTAVLTKHKKVLGIGILLALGIAGALVYMLAGCGGESTPALPPPPPGPGPDPWAQALASRRTTRQVRTGSDGSFKRLRGTRSRRGWTGRAPRVRRPRRPSRPSRAR